MRQLFRFISWVLSQAIWFCISLVVSSLGVYFAIGVTGWNPDQTTLVGVIIAIALGSDVASEVVVRHFYNRRKEEGEP